ncbi:MAG: hypothetical protein IKW83_04870 [Muribaculaceae bacterium]|nr:hypothetical protein [Muribaculaceae bacterium]
MKKFFVLFAAVAALSLASCSNGDASSTPDGQSQATTVDPNDGTHNTENTVDPSDPNQNVPQMQTSDEQNNSNPQATNIDPNANN